MRTNSNVVNSQIWFSVPLKELSHFSFKYGYVTHTNQRGLYKLDLVNLRYTRSVDLTPYNCVPEQVQFSALCKFGSMFFGTQPWKWSRSCWFACSSLLWLPLGQSEFATLANLRGYHCEQPLIYEILDTSVTGFDWLFVKLRDRITTRKLRGLLLTFS